MVKYNIIDMIRPVQFFRDYVERAELTADEHVEPLASDARESCTANKKQIRLI